MPQEPDFFELLHGARHSALHLEMRDQYGVGDEAEHYRAWQRTGATDIDPTGEYWRGWVDVIGAKVAAGVDVRRARIVSEPVTDYIRYEHYITAVNLKAGEQVRWLPRRRASDLALPGNDFWLFDGEAALFNHFTGIGEWASPDVELRTEPAVAALCAAAFEAVWERAVPHEDYTLR